VGKPQVIDDEEHERAFDRVAAVDVAKKDGVVCVRGPPRDREERQRRRRQTGKSRACRRRADTRRHRGSTAPAPAAVAEIARVRGVSAAQIRLAWTLSLGPHVLAIPGTGNPITGRERPGRRDPADRGRADCPGGRLRRPARARAHRDRPLQTDGGRRSRGWPGRGGDRRGTGQSDEDDAVRCD
jgi:hypothetical protein